MGRVAEAICAQQAEVELADCQARCAALDAQLKELVAEWQRAAKDCAVYNHVQGDAEDVFTRCEQNWTTVFFCRVAHSEGHPLNITPVLNSFKERTEAAESRLKEVEQERNQLKTEIARIIGGVKVALDKINELKHLEYIGGDVAADRVDHA
jgi:hypothetical protein